MKKLKFMKTEKVKAMAWLDSYIDSLDDAKTFEIEVKEIKRKRSLSANAYAWVLMDKLSAVTGIETTAIYRTYIRDIGDNMQTMRVEDRAVDMLCELWQGKGLGWLTDKAYSGYEGWTDVFLWYGSSTFDRRQMAKLIDLIIQDCKEYGVEVDDPEEIERLVSEWKAERG